MLGLFKLESCQPGASRELALRPPRPEKLQCSKYIFSNVIVIIIGTHLFFLLFFEQTPNLKFKGL